MPAPILNSLGEFEPDLKLSGKPGRSWPPPLPQKAGGRGGVVGGARSSLPLGTAKRVALRAYSGLTRQLAREACEKPRVIK